MSGGKRAASSELAEEPDAKAAKLDDAADGKEKPAEATEELAADQEGEDGAPTRRSSRARNPARKGRDPLGKTAKGPEPKMVTVTYKEGDVLGEHLNAVGTLVEVKIPAESTVSGNPQVRARQLWGTDVYTSDSDLVAVLMHCGYYLPSPTTPPSLVELRAILRATAPEESYASTSRNGVRSRSWGAVRAGCSFAVESCSAVLSAAKAKEAKVGAGALDKVAAGNAKAAATDPKGKELSVGGEGSAAGAGAGAGAGAAPSEVRGASRDGSVSAPSAPDEARLTVVALKRGADRFAAAVPTFFPNNVEQVVNTRHSAANSERRGKLIQEVTVQYNLCNEPWLKYGAAAVADQGFKKSEWTAARLRRESLFLESHAHRYELSFDGDPEAVDDEGRGLKSEDRYRFGRCAKPRSVSETARLGVPLPASELKNPKTNLAWADVKFSAGSIVVAGEEIKVVRLQFMART